MLVPWSVRMSRRSWRTIVLRMLNQLHTAGDLAADRRRTLRAEADAYRLARTARRGGSAGRNRRARHGWFQLFRPRGAQPAGRAPA